MLTQQQYNALWTNPMPHGFGMPLHNIPSYHQYLQREIYFQDYLDLFGNRKVETFQRHPIIGGKKEYVKINGDPILSKLNIPICPNYVLRHTDGKDYLIVDYDFPYSGELNKGRCIKYILVAEACPLKGKNYFYDIREIKNQGYLNAAYNASYNHNGPAHPWTSLINSQGKIDCLLDLARRGVLLLDLFPFSFSYSTYFREILNNNQVTVSFWNNNNNPYSLENRLTNLKNLVCIDWDLCMAAPEKISSHVLGLAPLHIINNGNHLAAWNDTNINPIINAQCIVMGHILPIISNPFINRGGKINPNYIGVVFNNLSHIPVRKKLTVLAGGNGPNANMITNAFY